MGSFGILCNKMYVRWKILLGLGTGFWILLCLYDTYLVDPVTKFYYSDSDEYEWLSQVAEEEIVQDSVPIQRKDEINFSEDTFGFGTHLIIWNIITFLVAFVTCAIGKIALARLWKFRNFYRHVDIPDNIELMCRRSNSSKIPVLLPIKSATTNTFECNEKETQLDSNPSFIHNEKGLLERGSSFLSGSSTSIELTVKPSKSDMSSRHEQQMEKQCAKLRDEMILIQASSLKEHAALSRKLELVTREKRDLCRQLMMAQKENRGAKLQLEELLSEKAMLIKRLECASKEFKVNTKSKKQALVKLEESQAIIASLKQEIERITKEKETLQNKLQILDVEHRLMKERLAKFEPDSVELESSMSVSNISNEPQKDIPHNNQVPVNLSKELKKTDMNEISQSQRDVQRVQMRLINLEKSLDKLKLSRWTSKEEPSESVDSDLKTDQDQSLISAQTDSDHEFNTSTLISTQSENPLEEQESEKLELFSKSDNLTDEQRRKILAPADSSGDEYSINSKRLDSLMEDFRIDDPFERAGNILNFLKNTPSPRGDRFDFNGSEDTPVNETSTSLNEDEDTDEWEPPKNRFVSHSAAFKKFLKSMDRLDKNHRKFAVTSNMF